MLMEAVCLFGTLAQVHRYLCGQKISLLALSQNGSLDLARLGKMSQARLAWGKKPSTPLIAVKAIDQA